MIDFVANLLRRKPKCQACKRSGVKLWREYNTFLDAQSFECGPCALKSALKGSNCSYKGPVDEQGRVTVSYPSHPEIPPEKTYAIGWRVPAIPDGEGSYWGYTSAPTEAIQKWISLPT